MDRRFDVIELAREGQRDRAVQRIARSAEEASYRLPLVAPIADPEPELEIADLSPEATLDAMYQTIGDVRLDLVYCPTISGNFRKRWANRLGEINLRSASAAAEIDRLRNELAIYERDFEDELDLEVAQIDHKLWRLRELCLRHQEFMQSARK